MEKQIYKSPRSGKFKSGKPPLAYSVSNVEPPLVTLNAISRNINAKWPLQPVSTTWLQVKSQVRGTDPTAPHLKYGVFPQKRHIPSGIAIRTVNSKPIEAQPTILEYSSGEKKTKKPPKQSLLSDTPLFVFRNIDKRETRHLSQSEILHVDIKPLRNPPMSPIRNSMSRISNTMSPTHSMSPAHTMSPSLL